MHSLSRQQKTFYFFLGGMFLLHASFLLVKLRDQTSVTWQEPEAIKIKLVQELS
jgi:uncharacterized membrane protein YecN with MAPEG domain